MFHASTKDVQLQNCALVRRAYQRRIKLISVDSINKFLTPLTASASEQQPVTKEAPMNHASPPGDEKRSRSCGREKDHSLPSILAV
jgi:hypothetical protein